MNKALTTVVLSSKKVQTNTLLKITFDSLIEAHERVENETREKQVLLESQFFKNFEALGKTPIPADQRKNLSQVQLKLWEIAIDRQKRPEIYEDIEKRYAFPGRNPHRQSGVNQWQEKPIDKTPEARQIWEYLLICPAIPGAQKPYCQAAMIYLSLLDKKAAAQLAGELLKTIPNHPGKIYLLDYATNQLDKVNTENLLFFLQSNCKKPHYEYDLDSFINKIKKSGPLSAETRKDIQKSVLAIQAEQHKNRTYSIPYYEADRFFKYILDALRDVAS